MSSDTVGFYVRVAFYVAAGLTFGVSLGRSMSTPVAPPKPAT